MTPHHPHPDLDALLTRSREVIATQQADNGAYPASPTFSAYRGYCWLRDGSFIAEGMSAAGAPESAGRFFDWCSTVVLRHADTIDAIVRAAAAGAPLPDDRMLPARFTMDGDLGHDQWWDFQLDGYGTWLWAMTEHASRHGLDRDRWRTAAGLTVDYLVSSWDRPCYDWWEEHDEHVHVSTLGCVAAGLRAAVDHGVVDGERAERALAVVARILDVLETRGTVDGHLTKWLGTREPDGSLSALVAPLGLIDPAGELAGRTLDVVERELSTDGGVYRFRADTFYGGGRWPLLTCFYGLARAARGERDKARAALDWAASTATDDLLLPEQVDGALLDPSTRQEWVDRWGTVATPLLWSHAMLLRLAAAIDLTDTEETP
ncbi:glycoside hydrolase family 15 protein [Isoptericola sp. b408]|uniref:glycoside hydrolase family 15 protein n=1 Tax=Isoptericola sp. b408 TaxID=3064653 RepID=UPI00271300D9|nr:glycoside hydrolase family 15 protein [Isoptericola sp. b408]MDO8150951.1 glycoside hydrolase family 15 protein [Isoptericola sp. b408]